MGQKYKKHNPNGLLLEIYADVQVLKAKVSWHDKLLYAILSLLVAIMLKIFLF